MAFQKKTDFVFALEHIEAMADKQASQGHEGCTHYAVNSSVGGLRSACCGLCGRKVTLSGEGRCVVCEREDKRKDAEYHEKQRVIKREEAIRDQERKLLAKRRQTEIERYFKGLDRQNANSAINVNASERSSVHSNRTVRRNENLYDEPHGRRRSAIDQEALDRFSAPVHGYASAASGKPRY